MHVFKDIVRKNTFTPELTYMFNMQIPGEMLRKAMSLIIAQDSIKKDLYYSLTVYSNANFSLSEPEAYEFEYEIIIDQENGGGTPNEDTFYTNPQVYFKSEKSSSKKFN